MSTSVASCRAALPDVTDYLTGCRRAKSTWWHVVEATQVVLDQVEPLRFLGDAGVASHIDRSHVLRAVGALAPALPLRDRHLDRSPAGFYPRSDTTRRRSRS